MSVAKDNSYRLVITTDEDEIRDYEFDKVDEITVNTSSEITNHPIVNGDIIADHMFRQPTTVQVSGAFSLNGNQPTRYNGAFDRMTNIQDVFEDIKNKGTFCRLVMRNRSNDASTRFKVRRNMVLQNMSWTQKQNSMTFNFTFVEALTVNVEEAIFDEDIVDANLPAITDASTLDFTDTLLDWPKIDEIVIQQLRDLQLASEDFLTNAAQLIENLGGAFVAGAIAGTVAGATAVSVVAGICGGLSAIPGAGWVAAGVIAGVAFIAVGLYAFFNKLAKDAAKKRAEKEYRIKAFEYYKEDRKNQQEVKRFINYIGQIHMNLEHLEDVMQVYGIAKNENQECLLYIDDKYYVFKFVRNNTNNKYSLIVTDIEDNIVAEQAELTPLNSIDECTRSNCLYRTSGGGFFVYLINLKTGALITQERPQSEIDEVLEDLTSYAVFVAQTDMEQFNEMLGEIVVDAMKM